MILIVLVCVYEKIDIRQYRNEDFPRLKSYLKQAVSMWPLMN
jgi:hypothetical protein